MLRDFKPQEKFSNKIMSPYLNIPKPRELTIHEIRVRMGLDKLEHLKEKTLTKNASVTPSMLKDSVLRGGMLFA